MKDLTKQLLKSYSRKKAEQESAAGASDTGEQLWTYRKAAALLHAFVPDSLQPPGMVQDRLTPFAMLENDLVHFSGGFAAGLYTLKPAIRNAALKQFGSRQEMLECLTRIPERLMTPLQAMWEEYLENGQLPDAEELSYRKLIDLHQIVMWLDGIEPDLPDQTRLLTLIKRKSVLANFEHLVTSNFTGRVHELDMLRQHARGSRQTMKPVLSIYGPGGIGKSALVGKILYEAATARDGQRLPYIYIAFDQPSMRIENITTILTEAASQLELQYPDMAATIQQFNNSQANYNTGKTEVISRSVINESRGDRLSSFTRRNYHLVTAFGQLLSKISEHASAGAEVQKNVIFAFDTFEEVQYRDRESLLPFWTMLDIMTISFPGLRILIAGRATTSALEYFPEMVHEVPLTELDLDDRLELLRKLGIRDKPLAMLVAERVGGNPLSLRLAARVIRQEYDLSDPDKIIPPKWLFFQMDEQIIQGQLYKRILDHIHSDSVRKLAHPGMALRKLTPELIYKVLAPVCGVDIDSVEEARGLFEELEKEHALVQFGESGTLEYRPEIREIMVRLLQQDKFEELRQLHRVAIGYYVDKEGIAARAEELYHRLALDEDDDYTLTQRWVAGIEQSVATSLEEYSDRMKAWLASKMSLEVPREVFHNANTIEWERNITRKVKRAILNMDLFHAFDLLGERAERSSASPLYALEAKANILAGRQDVAGVVLDEGINRISQSNNRGKLAELFWLKSQIAVSRNEVRKADGFLHQAQLAVQHATNPLIFVHIVCQRLLLHKSFPGLVPGNDSELRAGLSAACMRLSRNQKSVPGFIIRMAIGFLQADYPKTVVRLEDYFLFYPVESWEVQGDEKNMLTNENLRGLEKYREEWETDDDNDDDRFLQAQFENFA